MPAPSLVRKMPTGRLGLRIFSLLLPFSIVVPCTAQVVVTDPGNTSVNQGALSGQLGEYGETAARWAERLKQWNETFAHYQQQIAAMQSLINAADLKFPVSLLDSPLNTVDLNDGVEQKCHPSASGLSLSGILGALSQQLNLTNGRDIVGQQRELCSKMVMMENMKYNEAVALINTTMPKMTDQYTKILSNVQTVIGDTQGNQDQKANDIAAVDAQTQAQFRAFEQRMKQYDAYITSLEARQRTLAQMAFKGDKGVVGTLVQTTALAGALKVNE
ncbi:hypothetical protein EA658_14030 [Pseudoxanthomonas winnipegensis]|jgi:hypothetical protein|uniref:Type IV secretion system protein VirB5 n=1 Tax=Pseudoxanthomonas winnipegensis TaxID=2480810 RepID=A0ABY1WB74_9GAMM|nr:hypothetical protein [Pseudoxanthomonas winnipegensis]TAA10826.1 hypothetical protein EA659_05440 [Pseudoxanthomonas winnipegensis]TAA18253.1 hypothetical protein EA658_14030 [Pseudoxanthomonas winnipegensis]TAH74373.1 hypothetical protein EA657_02720 [Pseudoxanthomonas winnipegensis]